MLSVIIPAHDEAQVIGRCLECLTAGLRPGEVEIVVVCNGCRDDSAQVVKRFSERNPGVRVLETEVASKTHALNLGEEHVSGFPRFYVDADVELSADHLRQVAACLERGERLAASPEMSVDLSGCSWAVRRFYEVWTSLPYVHEGTIGGGVYALSRAGRERFVRFPDLTADDTYVRLQFRPEERLVVRGTRFRIRAPKRLNAVVQVKTRSHFGNLELRRLYPRLFDNEHVQHGRALGRMLLAPLRWPALAVYAYVKLRARWASRARLRRGDWKRWERDESSRSG